MANKRRASVHRSSIVTMGALFVFRHRNHLSCFTSFLAFLITSSNAVLTRSNPQRITMNLTPHGLDHFPYYCPTNSITDCTNHIFETSRARLAYLQSKAQGTSDFQFNLFSPYSTPALYVNFSLGQPPLPQLAIMDTGSTLLWVQCAPCKKCYEQDNPMLNPLKSSTYSTLSCMTTYCRYAPSGKCNPSNQCIYNQTYYDGTATKGLLAIEQLTFETAYEGKVILPNVVFGCGHENRRHGNEKSAGIVGLGSGVMSLISQFGSKFSYCIGNILDPNYRFNQLTLGEGAITEGDSTPMQVLSGLYYITLDGISIGEKMLDIGFNGPKEKMAKDVIIDSGSTFTWLVENAYRVLKQEVRGLLDGILKQVHVPSRPSSLCYRGRVDRDLIGFPLVTLHFADGADLEMETGSMFYQATPDIFCMAVVETDIPGVTIVGVLAQQYYNVGYDLIGNKLFLQRIDCELLEE